METKELKNMDQEWEKRIDEAFEEGYDEGYDEGRKEGYHEGYNEGREEGYERGYKDGLSENYDKGRDEAYKEIVSVIERRLRKYGFRVRNIDDVAYEIADFTEELLEQNAELDESVKELQKIVAKIDLKDITDEKDMYLIIKMFFDKISDIFTSNYKNIIDGEGSQYDTLREIRQKLGDKILSKILNFALLNLIINKQIIDKTTRILFGYALEQFLKVSHRISMFDVLYEELRRRYNFEPSHNILSIKEQMIESFLEVDLASSEYFYNEDVIYRVKVPENIRYVLSERVYNAMINRYIDTYFFRPKRVNYSEFFNVLYASDIYIRSIEDGLYPENLPPLEVYEARSVEQLRKMNIGIDNILEDSFNFRTKKALLDLYKSKNCPRVNLRILGCGGVNSNLIYMWIKSFVELYKFVPEIRRDILKFFNGTSIYLYDPDRYEISNIFRIIPPVQVGQPKPTSLARVLRFNLNTFTKETGLGSLDEKFSIEYLEKRILKNKGDSIDVFIGMVDLEERPSLYNKFKSEKLPFLEVTSLGDEIYFERNPVINSTDISLANETYGTLNPARFMSSFFFSWILVDEFLIDVLSDNYSFESTEKLSINTDNTAYYLFKTLIHYDSLKIRSLEPPQE
jgi:hypothetical protein